MPQPVSSSGRLVPAPAPRFRPGVTWLTRERPSPPGNRHFVDFGILRLKPGEIRRWPVDRETLLVLLQGRAALTAGGETVTAARRSLFDDNPTALQVGAGVDVTVASQAVGAEFAVLRARNRRLQGVRWYRPAAVASEDRGAGLAQEACRRTVRTLFDHASCPDSALVVGEVVNRAGRWSSYPPHHHAQPELYHYRFTLPQGYGHAEVGERVLKVRTGDTVEIPGGLDHAQVAAPGYGMYYLWVVRHLPRRPYRGFKFTAAHQWLLDPQRQGWNPSPASSSR